MHELSIATQIVAIAEQAARDAGAEQVAAVRLRLGALSGVVREALEFAWDFATEGGLLAGSTLEIEPVALVVRCAACGHQGPPVAPECLRCTECDRPTGEIVAGRELELDSLLVPDPATA